MKLASGVTDQYIFFVCVDSTDYVSRETGKTSSDFTVYRSRNGGTATAMTTPTINEVDAANMPGVYELLVSEDTTIAAGNQTEELCLHITATGIAPVTRTIELFRPAVTAGETITVSGGHVSRVTLCDTVTTNTDQRGTDSAATAANLSSLDGKVDVIDSIVDTILVDTNDLQTNQGNFATADVSALATAANLSSLDGKVDVIDSIVDTILVDTNDLQTNQGNFATADVSALATAANLSTLDGKVVTLDAVADAIKVTTDKLDDTLEDDSGVYRYTTNALEQAPSGGGGGGDATAANQATIISKLSTTTQVIQNPDPDNLITLIKGDDYDGTAQASISFDIGKSVAGASATFTIRSRETDGVILTTSGVCSSNTVTVSLTAAQTNITVGKYKYDLQVTFAGGSLLTASRGGVLVKEDQTR